jgi:GT2 family glycosyltransferase
MKETAITEEYQNTYFEKTLSLFHEAASATDLYSEVDLLLAGAHIRLTFCGATIRENILTALSHLIADDLIDAQPEFILNIWDSYSTGVKMLPPPCDRSHFTDRGDIWGFNSENTRIAFHYGEFSLNLFDKKSKQGIFWVQDPHHLPYWTTAAPLRTLIHWCMEMKGCQLLHAAAIGTDKGAVLLTGAGGSGKSTTALTGLCNGMNYCGDDYIVVSLKPIPSVHTLYSSSKVNHDNTFRFEKLKKYIVHTGGGEEKAVYQLFPGLKRLIKPSMPLVGVLAPYIRKNLVTKIYRPLNDKEIQRAASFTTVSQLPYSGDRTYAFIETLIQTLPSFCIDLGTKSDEVVDAIKSFITHPDLGINKDLTKNVQSKKAASLSVIIPVFNREDTIVEALDNIISQKCPELDIIVVNDGSTDNSEEVILNYNAQIEYFKQNNTGPAQARNRGIINSRTEYVAFLDSDDLWSEGMLNDLVSELETDREEDVVRGYAQLAFFKPETNTYEFAGNPRECFPNYITGTVFRKSVFDRVGLFDKDLRFGEDNDWFNRAEELGVKLKRLYCTSVIIRRHDNNMTKGKNLVELNVLRVFKKAIDRKRALQNQFKN